MPKYMINGSYTVEGLKGLLKEGGSGRLAATKQVFEAAGGTVESYYFTFGSDDFVVIVDMPDNATVAGLSLAAAATGAITAKTTVLLTSKEIDAAAKIVAEYRPPGH